jgi:hypothetical protein
MLTGCTRAVSLQSIQEYAKTVSTASASFDAIAADFENTCLEYREFAISAPSDLRTLPVTQPTPSATNPSPYDLVAHLPDCGQAADVSQQWKLRNSIITGYVRALAAIAGVDTKPSGFDTLASRLSDVGAIKQAQAKPFADLATSIASLLIRGRQDALLRKYVHEANAPLSAAAGSLAVFAETDYVNVLVNDRTQIDRDYQTSLRHRVSQKPIDMMKIRDERAQWVLRRGSVNQRIAAAGAYADTVRRIAQTNASLVQETDKPESAWDLFTTAKESLSPIIDNLIVLNKTFH